MQTRTAVTKTPTPALLAARVVHSMCAVAAGFWLVRLFVGGVRDANGQPLPIWVVCIWCVAFVVAACSYIRPAIGVIAFAVLATIIARYEPGVDVSLNTDVLNWIVTLTLTGVAVHSVKHRAHLAWPMRWRLVTLTLLALVLWIVASGVIAYVRLGWWTPDTEHHPRQFAQNLLIFLVASQFMGDRLHSLVLFVSLPLSLAIRGRFLTKHGVYLQEDIASLLVMTLPMALLAFTCAASRRVAWGVALLGLAIVAHNLWLLMATQNRGAIVALAPVLLAIWVVSPRKWIGPLIVLALSPVVFLLAQTRFSGTISRFTDLWTGGPSSGSAGERIALWRAGWEMGRDHPIAGVGPGHFVRFVREYVPSIRRDLPAHNNFIAMFAETGVPGVLLYGAVFLGAISMLFRTSAIALRDWPGPGARILIPCIVGYLAIGMFITRHDLAIAYLLAGWAVALHNHLFGPDILVPRQAAAPPPQV